MLALHVQVTGRKEFGVLDRQILEFRDRDQLVAAQIAYFIFDIPFFPTRIRIHEHRSEAVMLGKPLEAFRYIASAAFDDIRDDSTGVVEPDLRRYAADVFEDRDQPFQEALHVFTIVQLQITAIAIGET